MKRKEKVYLLIGIILFSLVIFSLFFQPHFVHDAYFDYGRPFVGPERFIPQGRVFSYLYFSLFNTLGVTNSFPVQMISTIGAVIFLSIAVFIIYLIIEKRVIKTNNLWHKAILLITIYGLIFNIYTTTWLVYFSVIMMALGVLLSTLAAYFYTTKEKPLVKYGLTLLFLVLAVFSYQPSLALGGSIILMVILYENKNKKIMTTIKTLVLAFIPYIVALLSNYIYVRLMNQQSADYRVGDFDIFYNLSFVISDMKNYFIEAYNYFPFPYLLIITLVAITIIIYSLIKSKEKNKIRTIIYIAITIVGYWFLTILPTLALKSTSIYILPRTIMYIGGIANFTILILILYNYKKILNNKLVTTLVIINFAVVTSTILSIQSENLKNSTRDILIGNLIIDEINKYEEESQVLIETIVLVPKEDISLTTSNIKYYGDLTLRGFSLYYTTKPLMMYLTEREFKVIEGTTREAEKYFPGYEADDFEIEQLYFENQVLYIYVY